MIIARLAVGCVLEDLYSPMAVERLILESFSGTLRIFHYKSVCHWLFARFECMWCTIAGRLPSLLLLCQYFFAKIVGILQLQPLIEL